MVKLKNKNPATLLRGLIPMQGTRIIIEAHYSKLAPAFKKMFDHMEPLPNTETARQKYSGKEWDFFHVRMGEQWTGLYHDTFMEFRSNLDLLVELSKSAHALVYSSSCDYPSSMMEVIIVDHGKVEWKYFMDGSKVMVDEGNALRTLRHATFGCIFTIARNT